MALRSLVARGLIEADAFQRGYVVRTDEPLPPELSNAVISRNQASPQLLDLVSSDLASLPLHGKGGLKERANLQDTRYDAV